MVPSILIQHQQFAIIWFQVTTTITNMTTTINTDINTNSYTTTNDNNDNRMGGDRSNYSNEISQNTEKSPGDLRKLTVT